MADEFTPEASVDFETLAAGMVGAPPPEVNGNPAPPIRPHVPQGPPPLQQRATSPPAGPQTAQQLDPFLALSELVRDSNLHGHELAQVRGQVKAVQLQTALMFGAALLLAVVVYKYARPAP